ncbi:hypothetical protein GOP47_0019093, partial [Adiantum capillus-veneris]
STFHSSAHLQLGFLLLGRRASSSTLHLRRGHPILSVASDAPLSSTPTMMDQQYVQLLQQQQQQQQQCPQQQALAKQQRRPRGWHAVEAPSSLLRTHNAIRDVLEALPPLQELTASNGKSVIALGQGDPSVFQYLKPPECAELALVDAIRSKKCNGYAHSAGSEECRRAVAEYYSKGLASDLTVDDVFITVGCTQAIEFCIAALATPGSNILLPRPGFPLYETFCSYMGVKVRYYDLLPEHNWEIDLGMLDMLTDRNTVAMIICNPSNPCGAVYNLEHLSKVVQKAAQLRLPIIADEIYGHIVFEGQKFCPVASLTVDVPILTAGGLSKRWMVPGWRLGWILVSDPFGVLRKGRVLEGLTKLAQLTVNTSTMVQAALPSILQNTPDEFYERSNVLLQEAAKLCCRRIQKIPGLECPSKPQGSMFIMVKINMSMFMELIDDIGFASALATEESVIVLPGIAFGTPNWMRIIFAAPPALLNEAWDRIEAFCDRHRSKC